MNDGPARDAAYGAMEAQLYGDVIHQLLDPGVT